MLYMYVWYIPHVPGKCFEKVTIIVLPLDLSFSKLYDAKDIEKKAIQYEFIIVREIRKV